VKGLRDKGLTEQLAAKLENEVMLKKCGLVDPEAERLATQRRRPLDKYLVDFEKHLRAKGRTPKYLKLILTRIRRVVKECEFRTAADLDRYGFLFPRLAWKKAWLMVKKDLMGTVSGL
jgi:hypothetical protein